ncbi:zinc ABC transporter ATP-binding protein AztA [Ochrobactrum sp. MYb379]|uniref:zinc ABC transporter ATP-binding protein AztA n=1 Tax=Ochrobactrum sp. MYb379 TaxID=2745275 RepID=UPI0030B2984C
MSNACLIFDDLTLGYNKNAAVQNLTGTVDKGSLIAVVGGNGSGKSTLMKGVSGLLTPISGACIVDASVRVAYLPQRSELDNTFPARVLDLLTLGLWPRRGLLGRYTSEDRKVVGNALSSVGLDGFENVSIDALSGGQLQRALFARVIIQNADLILLDEPFNAVDEQTICDLLALIEGWHQEGRTIMVVIHDLQLVRDHFPEALLLANYPVAWGDAKKTLSLKNLRQAREYSLSMPGTGAVAQSQRAYARHSAGKMNTVQ